MQTRFQRIAPCLWFDDQAEEAVNLYLSVFDNARIVTTMKKIDLAALRQAVS